MTNPEPDLEVVWSVLETRVAARDGLQVHGSGVFLPEGEVLVASGADGRRHLLLPVDAGAPFAPDTSTRGVHITRRRLETGEGIAEFVDVECRLVHLNPVFASLASDMLDAATATPERPGVACRTVLDRWREFLGSDRSPLLAEERIVGLLAELLVLRDVLALDPDRRLDAWTGPSGAPHDLRRGPFAIEVKATQARNGRFVPVNGVDQLEAPTGGTLHLAWMRFEADASSTLSIPAVVRDLRRLGPDMIDLTARLAAAGYDAVHTQDYERHRYRLVESRFYRVDASFPRIVPGTFDAGAPPPGVLNIRYSVDLTNEPPTPVDERGIAAAMEAVARA